MPDLYSIAPATPASLDPERWRTHLFWSRAAIRGGGVRRKARNVERIVGWPPFQGGLRRRGLRVVVNGGRVVVFCNTEALRLLD
jgi:hypothetical protein